MAALVSSLAETILGNLSSELLQELGSAWGLESELEKLESVFSTVQSVLQDAEERKTRSRALSNWLTKLKDAAYDAEDILDELASEATLHNSGIDESIKKRVCNVLSFHPVRFRREMVGKINDILKRLDAIAEERSKFHLNEGVLGTKVEDSESRITSSFVSESEIYGRDEEKEKIIGWLLLLLNSLSNVQENDDVSIYAIFGMGGLGKTTLAQLVYNDERVQRHFELKIWVCVSDDFGIKRLTKAMIEAANGNVCKISELDPLLCQLRGILQGKRYLLVLDDVWNEDQEKWERLKPVLRCGANGSSVIVTTRAEKVAQIMATVSTNRHHLELLDEDDCWSLFKKRAFGVEREEDPNLIAIGKEIVKKCGRVPLAVKCIGGLLRFKRKESEWLSIKESDMWDIQDDGSGILPSLRLSYNHIPLHLRQCFAYCSLFQKDAWIEKDQLIQLWMANGFIPLKGRMELEDIGDEIFNDLLWRSFFQEPEKDMFGNVIRCKIHDLLLDLAQSVMGNECVRVELDWASEIPKRARHLAWHRCRSMFFPLKSQKTFESLRSILLISYLVRNSNESHQDLFSNIPSQGSLRLRSLQCYVQDKLPNFIGECKHLRYLNISHSLIKMLPECIIGLQNLQTLILNGCASLIELPKGLKHMTNLRNLDIEGCDSLTHMPSRMRQLTSLRVLSKFLSGKDSGNRIKELKDLNLKGKIEISHLENVRNFMDAQRANLAAKHKLESLSLAWCHEEDVESQVSVDEEVLEGLQPSSNLKWLVICGYLGTKLPNWISDSLLPNVIEVRVMVCERCENISSLGKLPLLKRLYVGYMNVKHLCCELDVENMPDAFPALQFLNIFSAPNLEGFAKVARRTICPSLKTLTIYNCRKLKTLPHLPTLTELRIECSGNLIPLPRLPRLESLIIDKSSVTLSEEGLQGLSSLRDLNIIDCPELICLTVGMQYVTSLEQLHISYCTNLISLPEGLQNLVRLSHLRIVRCPHLNQRCQREMGEDWHKIAHIPRIWVDHQRI